MSTIAETEFPCAFVDAELSPLVRRSFSLTTPGHTRGATPSDHGARLNGNAFSPAATEGMRADEQMTVLRTEYKATTNRMLRVAVNGFMESLGVVLGVMEELDVDVLVEDR
ncbi:hypothetical protein OEA41_000831 [Lepraria neglecta]|uniref:Transcription factor Pcc1 n=1 Tax=Lepraria neglecta TaxID=209136 RepID=A0AAD9ZGD4_9LECA|nr:hypothetical protein OEA41_000831 [Lepraria neglecta]